MRAVKIKKTPITSEDPELAARFNRILTETVEAMEEARIRYAFIGGIASSGLGRPRSTRDIDLFVTPEDADLALQTLAKRGFRTEKTDTTWLYKGFKEDILVDIIFKSKGDIYFDTEMYKRMTTAEFHGKRLRIVAPEDLLIIKAAAHSELTPGHWHDAIALLSHAQIDWEYLIRRARRAPRRILSLLLYAQSNDIGVPNQVIHTLYRDIFGGTPSLITEGSKEEHIVVKKVSPISPIGRGVYGMAHLREILAEDPRTHELDIRVESEGNKILLRGDVPVPERREAVEKIAKECFPNCIIENQIRVLTLREPNEGEDFR